MLGEVMRLWRQEHRLSVREAAAQVGISAATWNRIERGHGLSAQVLVKLLDWLVNP